MTQPTIPKTTSGNALLIILILAVPLSAFWIVQSYQVYKQDVRQDEKQYMERQKELISGQVRYAIDFIGYMKSQAESRAQNTIRDRVYEAHSIATNLYEKYRDSKSLDELKAIVRETLRPIRYSNGRGYYFAQAMDGINQIFADRPSNEGKSLWDVKDTHGAYVIRDMNRIIEEKGEGFYSYTWTKPGMEGRDFVKMSFMKYFEPFDWYFGSGEYLADTEAEIKKEVADRLSQIRWGEDGYVFVFHNDGLCISHMNPANTGTDMWETLDPNGKPIIQDLIRLGRSGGGYMEYVWNKPSKAQDAPKLAYAEAYEAWDWVIGAGTYLDDIDPVLEHKKERLQAQLSESVLSVAILVLVTSGLAVISSSRLSRRLKREFGLFDDFFRHAADTGQELGEEELSFAELRSLGASANAMVAKRRQYEEALRRSEGTLQSVVQAAPIGIGVMKKRSIDWTNEQLARMTGYSRSDLAGMSTEALFENQEAFEQAEQDENGQAKAFCTESIETSWRRRDGSSFDLLLSSAPIDSDAPRCRLGVYSNGYN